MKRVVPFLCGGLVVLCLGATMPDWWKELDEILIRLDSAQAYNMNAVRELQVRVRVLEEWRAKLATNAEISGPIVLTNAVIVWDTKP